jgi:hypothetical protein
MADKSRPELTPRRPSADLPPAADDWVRQGAETPAPPATPELPAPTPEAASASEPTKRLTIEVPASLHHAIMVHARVTGITAKDEITPLLRKHYADALRLYAR